MTDTESHRATLAARILAFVAAATAVIAAGLDSVERIITVPSLPEGIFRERVTTVAEFRELPLPKLPKMPEPLIEHTAEESDFQVDARPTPPPPSPEPVPEPLSLPPEPVVEPPPPPEPEPIPEPKPIPEPPKVQEIKPEPKPTPKPVEKPKPLPKVKVAPKPVKPAPPVKAQPIKAEPTEPAASSGESSGDAVNGTSSGMKGAGAVSGNAAANNENAALAIILREVNAQKRYPRRARQSGQEGRVLLAVQVNDLGIITAVDIAEKHASVLLNRAALQAASGLVGMKVPLTKALTIRVPIVFSLSD